MKRLSNKPSVHSSDSVQGSCLGWFHTLREGFIFVLPVVLMLLCCMQLDAAALPSTSGEDVIEEEVNESVDDTDTALDGSGTVSGGDSSGQILPEDEVDTEMSNELSEAFNAFISLLTEESDEEIVVYESLEEFEATPASVTRYEYEVLKRLEFLQYSQAILIGLIFVLIFKKK